MSLVVASSHLDLNLSTELPEIAPTFRTSSSIPFLGTERVKDFFSCSTCAVNRRRQIEKTKRPSLFVAVSHEP